jgi:hypothetical protein
MKRLSKYKKIFLPIFISLLFVSCEKDYLDVSDPNNLTPDTFWKTEQDAIKAITGTYALFQYQVWSGIWGFYEIHFMNRECRSDLIHLLDMWSPFGGMSRYEASLTSYVINDFWSFSYQGLYAANQVIENVPGMNLSNGDVFVAEAKFLRAYAHFNLLINFGNIVLSTSVPKDSDEYYKKQSTQQEVFAQIEKDLTEAKSALPLSWEEKWLGRATKGAASTLLAKAYLWQNKWGQAETELKEIVNSGQYSLESDFESLFTGLNEHNSESIFELNFTLADDGGRIERNALVGMQTWRMHTPNDYTRGLFLGDTTTTGEFSQRVTGSIRFDTLATDDVNDLHWNKYVYTDEATQKGYEFFMSGTNFIVYRYADVLLLLAEALNELGSTGEAEGFLNQVRTRAGVPDISGMTQDQLREHIRHVERPLELLGETGRFYDLLRWYRNGGDLRSVLIAHGREAGDTFDNTNDLYYPIPASETTSNPLIVQNPGY